jgi:excinuclease ABC subunit C
VLRAQLKTLSGSPGVYRFLNEKGELLYVGKARNLKKRVTSYFRTSGLSPRIHAMMQSVASIDVTVTHTEGEALLLENNLIKSLRPRYNVLLRDDKSYPYIYLAEDHPFPRITFHRGARRGKGRYFGPFPSAGAVRESLQLLQKMFPVRQCEDTVYRNRSRPCLQYQIKRCSAPCVGLIDESAYREDVHLAILFLEGRSQALTDELAAKMEQASLQQDYERAALLRDRIATLGRIQERQYVSGEGGDADVLAVATEGTAACIVVTYIRDGRNLGNKVFFPKLVGEATREEVLSAFLPQYYLDKPTPAAIYVSGTVADRALLEETLTAQQGGKRVRIVSSPRGAPRRWVQMAQLNAADALRRQLASQASLRARFESLQEALGLDEIPARIECFDVSHTQGEATVASCVVFDQNGPVKSDYRRFNIEGVAAGDDYGALQQALTRRYQRLKEGEGRLPDLLLIDGGRGQLHVAEAVLQELQVEGVKLVGVAKGPERKPGKEQLFLSGTDGPTILPADSAGLHLIQQVRDEAHRFAITGHRQRRAKARVTSSLEQIPGIGKKRRQALLQQLGGLQSVARAGIEDLMRVPGISPALAQRIYDAFHEANQ